MAQGQGKEVFTTDEWQESSGTYVDGKRHGHWTEHYENGIVAEGPYVDDKRHGSGLGIMRVALFEKGPYVDGKAHGKWTWHYESGTVAEGPYVDGKAHGKWTRRLTNGTVQTVRFVDHKRQGQWTRSSSSNFGDALINILKIYNETQNRSRSGSIVMTVLMVMLVVGRIRIREVTKDISAFSRAGLPSPRLHEGKLRWGRRPSI